MFCDKFSGPALFWNNSINVFAMEDPFFILKHILWTILTKIIGILLVSMLVRMFKKEGENEIFWKIECINGVKWVMVEDFNDILSNQEK